MRRNRNTILIDDGAGIFIPYELGQKYGWESAALASGFFYDRNCLSKSQINYLKRKGLIVKKSPLFADEIREILIKKTPQSIGNKTCEWCTGKTFILHQHHYPLGKKQKGKTTVSICANCHAEFHYLMEYSVTLIDDVLKTLIEFFITK